MLDRLNYPDVYVCNDYVKPDYLYINNGDGTFTDKFSDYFAHTSFSSMGSDYADVNNDGCIDMMTLDMFPEDNYRQKMHGTEYIKLADLKIQETDLMLREKTNDIQIKFENYITEWRATPDQIEIFGKTVELYKQMLEAERRLFNIGESSLFVVNSREQAYINAQIKLTEIVAKNKVSYYAIWYFTGRLPDM